MQNLIHNINMLDCIHCLVDNPPDLLIFLFLSAKPITTGH